MREDTRCFPFPFNSSGDSFQAVPSSSLECFPSETSILSFLSSTLLCLGLYLRLGFCVCVCHCDCLCLCIDNSYLTLFWYTQLITRLELKIIGLDRTNVRVKIRRLIYSIDSVGVRDQDEVRVGADRDTDTLPDFWGAPCIQLNAKIRRRITS